MSAQNPPASSLTVNNLALASGVEPSAVREVVTALPPGPVAPAPAPTTSQASSASGENNTQGLIPQSVGSSNGPPAVATGSQNTQASSVASVTSDTATLQTQTATAEVLASSVTQAESVPPPPASSAPTTTSSNSQTSITETANLGPSSSSSLPPATTTQTSWSSATSWTSSSSVWSEPAPSVGPAAESTWTNPANTDTWVAAAVAVSSSSTISSSTSSTAGTASSANSAHALTDSNMPASTVSPTSKPTGTGLVVASSGLPGSNATRAGAETGEDGATSSEKGGIGGGAVAGIVIALLIAFGVGWLVWMKMKKRSVDREQDPFWSRFFGKQEENDAFDEKHYDRQEDDAIAFGSVLAGPSHKKSKSGHEDDGASSFYIPSKSTKPIESQYFGAGDSPLEPPRRLSDGRGLMSDQSSWLGPPPPNVPAISASRLQNEQYRQAPLPPMPDYGQAPVELARPAMPALSSYQPAQSQYSSAPGRQSIAPGGYNADMNHNPSYDEVLRDSSGTLKIANQSARESLSSYYSSSDAETPHDSKKRSLVDSIYSTWGNASSIGGGARSAVSSAYMPFSDGRASRLPPQRKSTLKKSWKPQNQSPAAETSLDRRPSHSRTPTPPDNSSRGANMPRKPMAAMASTPTAVRNNVGFGAEDAPPMPLGWGHSRS